MALRALGILLIALGTVLLRQRRRVAPAWARSRAREVDRGQLLDPETAERIRRGLLDDAGLALAVLQVTGIAVLTIAAGVALLTGLAR